MDFIAELKNLVLIKPLCALNNKSSENCDFADYSHRSKNIYMSWFVTESEDCYYSEYLMKCRDCIDCIQMSSCELCLECTDCSGLYNCSHLQDCHNCSNCNFCYDCLNCKDCFGSFGLRQQKFCIFNKSYSEETYREKLEILKKNSPEKILSILEPEFEKHPRLYSRLLKGGEKCTGDYIYFSKNCHRCFNIRNTSDAAYVSDFLDPQNNSSEVMDCDFCYNLELCYDCFNSNSCNNCNFIENCMGCIDSEYCINCYSCQNCFGCAYIMNKQYCVLNRQCTREEYLSILAKLKKELKKSHQYGKSLADIIKST